MSMPFIDLKAQQRVVEQEIKANIAAVLEHCRFIMGPEVTEAEAALAEYAGVRHALTCGSGTDALMMLLMALDIGPGDAVFTSPYTFIATLEAIELVGATPVCVDVDPRSFNIDPERLALACRALKAGDPDLHPLPKGYAKLTPRAVMPVDLFGLPAEYDPVERVAAEHGLHVLCDAAQSFGAEYHGKKAASLGLASATSFFPAKPLGVYGDGGAVFTNDDALAETLVSVRVHGMGKDRYHNVRLGLNARFDTIQAAVLLPKLKIFPGELDARQAVADAYDAGLADVVETPRIPGHCRSAWAQYSILTPGRDALRETLAEQGIPTMVYYPLACHLQPAYAHLGYAVGDMPVSEGLSSRIVSLPMHPYLSKDDIARVIEAVHGAVGA